MKTKNKWSVLIRKIRAINRWSQEELSHVMGTDQATISRWERGQILPAAQTQEKLEALAEQVGLQSLSGIELLVNASPFPMILVDQLQMVVAASASSGFVTGVSTIDQTPEDEREHLNAFHAHLTATGFWNLAETLTVDPLNYEYDKSITTTAAVVVPLVVRGEVFALVQKRAKP